LRCKAAGAEPSRATLSGVMADQTRLLDELLEIGIALTSERDLGALLERILSQARRFTRAEAGTVFLREGDHLRFAVVQNESLEARLGKRELERRLQAEPMPLSEPSLAGHVAQTGETINVSDAYAIVGSERSRSTRPSTRRPTTRPAPSSSCRSRTSTATSWACWSSSTRSARTARSSRSTRGARSWSAPSPPRPPSRSATRVS